MRRPSIFLSRPGCCLTLWAPPFLLPSRLLQIFGLLSVTDASDPIHGARIARQEALTTRVLSSILEQETLTRDDMSPVKGTLTHSRYPARDEELESVAGWTDRRSPRQYGKAHKVSISTLSSLGRRILRRTHCCICVLNQVRLCRSQPVVAHCIPLPSVSLA